MAWNKPSQDILKPSVDKTRAMTIIGCISVLLVIVFAFAIFLVLHAHRVNTTPEKLPAKTSHRISVSSRSFNMHAEPSGNTNLPLSVEEDEWSGGKYPGEKIISCQTNTSGYIVERTVDKFGRTGRHISSPPSPWKFSTDEILANVLAATARGEMAPLPPVTREEMDRIFRKSSNVPISIGESDDESLKMTKEMVKSAREEIIERMENGEHFLDIVADARKLFNENGRIRQNAVHELKEILRTGDAEDARKYMLRVNTAFSQMGIAEISEEDTQQIRRNKK